MYHSSTHFFVVAAIIVSFSCPVQAEQTMPGSHGSTAGRAVNDSERADLLKEVLDANEQSLLAAEKDLREAQSALTKARLTDSKTIGIVLTAAGIAGLVVSAKMIKYKGKPSMYMPDLMAPFVNLAGVGGAAVSVGAIGTGATSIYFSVTDIPKAEALVTEHLDKVMKAKEKVASAKARLESAGK